MKVRRAICCLACAGGVACVFDSGGLPGISSDVGAVDVPPLDFAVVDASADIGRDTEAVDAASDAAVDPACRAPVAGRACRSTSDRRGEAGRCVGGKFERTRYCFSAAPCQAHSGLCIPSGGCNPCDGSCNCSAFDVGGQLRLCCSGASSNGPGDYRSACSRPDECRSGLCASSGFCYEPCDPLVGCSGGACREVRFSLAGTTRSGFGCVSFGGDGGPDSTAPFDATAADALAPSDGTSSSTDAAGPSDGLVVQPVDGTDF